MICPKRLLTRGCSIGGRLLRSAIGVLVLGALVVPGARAAQFLSVGTITVLRNQTRLYGVAALQGLTIFQTSSEFGNGCNWVFISGTDSNALAVLLAAKATGGTVAVYCDNAVGGAWGDPTTCGVMAIEQD